MIYTFLQTGNADDLFKLVQIMITVCAPIIAAVWVVAQVRTKVAVLNQKLDDLMRYVDRLEKSQDKLADRVSVVESRDPNAMTSVHPAH